MITGLQFLGMIEQMRPLTVLSVAKKEQQAGADILRRFAGQRLTLTDAIGLHLMQTRDVARCWSTDRRLGLVGTPLVIHES